ncbi:hypothetical protein SO694_00077184 [Aureococcus anophagefferens]|uniref:Aminoglycoside phosphotransferase domain-containing protein n=1 Tax=Aureococcus anophagefferens TaxID=44056 RepID=A0ABR1FHS5_AURAN
MRAAPEPPSGDGRGPRAVYAVRRLLPDHVRAPSIKMRATSMGGSNGQTYRVDVPEQRSNGESVQESYFVRVLPAGYEANAWNRRFAESCVANTVAASDAGVTAAVLAADETALVQQFIPSARVETTAWRAGRETGATWRNTLEDHADARRFGAMVAAIHAVPYPDPSAPLAPHCFYCWYDMPEWYARDPSLLACWEYMEAREPPPGVGGEVVFTHGDLHLKNLLVSLEDGSLVPVDLELSGRGHRASDLAFFFWHWSPSFAARNSNLQRDFNVGDEDLRDAIIEQGVLALAAAGHAPGDDDAGLFGHCSTPCACS